MKQRWRVLPLLFGSFAAGVGPLEAAVTTATGDTLIQIPVSDVVVVRYRVGGSAQHLNGEAMQSQGAYDLAYALNQIPGVRMETRGMGGSRRIDIRGSGLRSPFGVRNTQILVNGFLLSTADGVGQTEWLDPLLLDRLVVMKGPTGAWLGSGYGGALVGSSLPEFQLGQGGARRVWGELRAGSLGAGAAGDGLAWRAVAGAQWHGDRDEWRVQAAGNLHPGYRDQEANDKVLAEVHWRRYGAGRPGVLHHLWLSGYSGGWELPGALDSTQAADSPTLAPGAPYAAQVNRDRIQAAYSLTHHWGGTQRGLYVLAHGSEKTNPFGTSRFFRGYKWENEWGGNIRLTWRHQRHQADRGWHVWDASAIGQADRLFITEWDSLAEDQPKGFRYDLTTDAYHGWVGGGYAWHSHRKWTFSGQVGWEGLHRSTLGTARTLEVPWSERYRRSMPLPRLMAQRSGAWGLAWLQWTTGISHPTTFEWVHPEQFVPYDLQPESAACWETGLRSPLERPWQYEFAAFSQRVRNAIGPVANDTDGPLLDNASEHRMLGAEGWAVLSTPAHGGAWGQASFEAMATWNRFVYGPDEHLPERRLSQLPGNPEWTLGGRASWRRDRLELQGHVRWNSRTPLNDANTDWAPAQSRFDLEAGFRTPLPSGGALRWRLTCLNVLQAEGSSWWTVNANAGRYHNPMPPRTMQIALRWEWGRAAPIPPYMPVIEKQNLLSPG